jgi:hypothetical protein
MNFCGNGMDVGSGKGGIFDKFVKRFSIGQTTQSLDQFMGTVLAVLCGQ